jgi:hypothetical protein
MAPRRGDIRPGAFSSIVPSAVGEKGEAWWRIAIAQRVIKSEVLQFIGADNCLGFLGRPRCRSLSGHKLWADLGV